MHTAFAATLVVLGAFLTFRFRQAAGWYDHLLRTLADGPEAAEPERRGVFGQWAMVGTGKSAPARWYRAAAVLAVGLGFLVVGVGGLAGVWRL